MAAPLPPKEFKRAKYAREAPLTVVKVPPMIESPEYATMAWTVPLTEALSPVSRAFGRATWPESRPRTAVVSAILWCRDGILFNLRSIFLSIVAKPSSKKAPVSCDRVSLPDECFQAHVKKRDNSARLRSVLAPQLKGARESC